jgi:hypothetical protein
MIKIEIRKNEKLNGIDVDSAFVSFNYDVNLVNIMREEAKRAYHPETKVWEIPAKNLVNFLNKIEDHQIEIYGKITPKIKKELAYKFDYKTKPFDHQIEGFEFGLKYDKFILADEQGLGKTKQAIDIAVYKKNNRGYKHCLIIVGVNGLKWNWYNEVKIHSNETAYILGQRIKKNGHEKIVIGGNADKLDDLNNLPENYFLITNIESIRDEKIMGKLKTLCDKKEINMIVFDELHKCFDYNTNILTEYGYMKIGEIVKQKLNLNVLSYNKTTKLFEEKPIKNWFENIVLEKLIELEFNVNGEIKKIKCTDNHLFFTSNRGWVQAKHLTEDDDILNI